MSSLASLTPSSSAAALHTRGLQSPCPVRAKDCGWCKAEGDRVHHKAAVAFRSKAGVRWTGESDGSTRASRSTATKAGLGRYAGAVHGNSKGKSRSRRRPPVQQDEHEERCDEHQDSITSSSGNLTTKTQEESDESNREEGDASSEGGVHEDGSQQSSYNRYLLEMGVGHRTSQGNSESERFSRESPRNLHVNASQLSDAGHLAGNEALSEVGSKAGGQGGELGDEGTEELNANGGKIVEKLDFVPENETKSENESISVEKTSPAVFPSSQANEVEDKAFGSDGGNTDTIPETQNAKELRSVSEGGALKKKRRKKLKSKAAVDTSLKVEERGDNEFVRASPDGAERPATPSDKGLEEFSVMNVRLTTLKKSKKLEPKVELETDEAPAKEGRILGSSAFFPVAEPADSGGQGLVALDSVVDANTTNETINESLDTPNAEDTPLSVLGKAGPATISVPSVTTDETEGLMLSSVVGEQPAQVGTQVVETVLEQAVQTAVKVVPLEIVEQTVETVTQVASKVVELPLVVVEQGAQVVDILPDVVTEQVGQVVDVVSDVAEHVANTVNEQVEQVGESVTSTASQVAEHVTSGVDTVTSTASQVAEHVTNGVDTVTSTASAVVDQVTELFSSDEEGESDSDDEFEAFITSELPEFRGRQGLHNLVVKQEDQGVLFKIYDLYTYMLKQSFPKFAAAMFFTPILVSGVFTLLYLPEFEGLAFDETARDFFASAGGDSLKLHLSWKTLFQVFMFSLSLSTGLQPDLTPLSPYTLVVANLNALIAQLVFVFLSGAVFARLSQPSQPLRCSTVALVSTPPSRRRRTENDVKVFTARYVLSGPQPCELVDVKVDLTYQYNTLTRTGSFFRATQSLKLVRPEIAFLTYGILVRHVIDETSPLYQRTAEMLDKEDAIFFLSVVGLERASMQSVFHVQTYCVVDKDVVWDAEFEDVVLINKKNRRVVDHSRLSMWRPVAE